MTELQKHGTQANAITYGFYNQVRVLFAVNYYYSYLMLSLCILLYVLIAMVLIVFKAQSSVHQVANAHIQALTYMHVYISSICPDVTMTLYCVHTRCSPFTCQCVFVRV